MEKCKEKDNNVYIKLNNGRYVPFGQRYDERYLGDGIWYVRHTDRSRCTTNASYMEGIYKVGNKPNKIDIPKICSMETYKDYVLNSKEMQAIIYSGKYSWNDLVGKIVALVVDLNEKYQAEDKSIEDDSISRF